MIDLFIISGSVALGLISAVFITRYAINRKNSNLTLLGNVKNELNNIEFERSVALEALGKINQFFEEKKIDEFERDRLSKKYNNMLDEYDKRVFRLTPILEAQEIYEYRKELNSIVSEYTKKIDARLKNLTGTSPNSFEYLYKGDDKAAVVTRTAAGRGRGAKGTHSSSEMISDGNKSESFFSKLASLKLNPKKNSGMFLEKELSLQNDKVTQSEYDKETAGDKSKNEDFIKKDKPDQYLSPSNKIDAPSTSSLSNLNKTSYTSDKAIDSTSKSISPNLLSTNNQSDNNNPHSSLSVSINDGKESSKNKESGKNVLDTGNEIEKIQSDILKTLRRLEDTS